MKYSGECGKVTLNNTLRCLEYKTFKYQLKDKDYDTLNKYVLPSGHLKINDTTGKLIERYVKAIKLGENNLLNTYGKSSKGLLDYYVKHGAEPVAEIIPKKGNYIYCNWDGKLFPAAHVSSNFFKDYRMIEVKKGKEVEEGEEDTFTRDELLEIIAGAKNNPLSSFVLNGDREKVTKALHESGYSDGEDVQVKVSFNGVEIRVDSFQVIMTDWWDRMENHIKEKSGMLSEVSYFEKRVQQEVQKRFQAVESKMFDLKCELGVD